MKILLNKFKKDEPLTFEEELSPEELDLDIGIMQFPNNLMLKVEAYKSGNDLTVEAHVEGERVFTCSLCLEEFNNLFEKDFTLHYDIKGRESVTLDQDVREELLLEHPIRILCRPDCKGLCAYCGTNLNDGQCDCQLEKGE